MKKISKNELKKLLLDGRLIGGLALLSALILVVMSIVNLVQTAVKESNNNLVHGVIVESFAETVTDSDGVETVVYFPVIEYNDENGQIVRAMSTTGKKYNEYKKGDKLSVKINKDNPNSFEIVPFRAKYALPIFLILIGIGIGYIGIRSILGYIKNRKSGISNAEN